MSVLKLPCAWMTVRKRSSGSEGEKAGLQALLNAVSVDLVNVIPLLVWYLSVLHMYPPSISKYMPDTPISRLVPRSGNRLQSCRNEDHSKKGGLSERPSLYFDNIFRGGRRL
jgi:hypothetical protein